MYKLKTNMGTLDAMRTKLAHSPYKDDMVDFGLRVASIKATLIDQGMVGDTISVKACSIYLLGIEHMIILDECGDLLREPYEMIYGKWVATATGAKLTRRRMRTRW